MWVLRALTSTTKASNFRPHGNFVLFFASSVASLNESRTKNELNQFLTFEVFLQILFSSFSVGRVSMIASQSGKEVQRFFLF
jgi:hypothetical protein